MALSLWAKVSFTLAVSMRVWVMITCSLPFLLPRNKCTPAASWRVLARMSSSEEVNTNDSCLGNCLANSPTISSCVESFTANKLRGDVTLRVSRKEDSRKEVWTKPKSLGVRRF